MLTKIGSQHRSKPPKGNKLWVYRTLGTSQLKNHKIYQLVSTLTAGHKKRGGWSLLKPNKALDI